MNTYTIEVHTIRKAWIEVEAVDEFQAIDKATELYGQGDINYDEIDSVIKNVTEK